MKNLKEGRFHTRWSI